LIEVVVAMMIFAMIATGALHATISTLSVTHDTRARQVAANLAAQEIDLARDATDLLTLVDETRDIDVNGKSFHVSRQARWIKGTGGDLDCGADSQTLRYKRVNIKVTWDNMRAGTKPVASDTVIDPNTRINDPLKGTILVEVLSPSGEGTPGVNVTATPVVPGSLPSYTADATDAEGCTYIVQVVPGNYNVTVEHTGDYVDENQSETSTTTVGVKAGAAVSAGFLYGEGGELRVDYASNWPANDLLLPNSLDTTFFSSYATHAATRTGSAPNTDRQETFALQAFPSGYQVVAGKAPTADDGSDGCLAVDPEAWATRTDKDKTYIGTRPPAVAASAGKIAAANVPMGIVTVRKGLTLLSSTYVTAVSVDTDDGGNPGCTTGMTYTFGPINTLISIADVRLALPYGSWQLYSGSLSSPKLSDDKNISVDAPSAAGKVKDKKAKGELKDVITLDPRELESVATGPKKG
jgi:type II secretory pathway pseudopilin PulG